MVCVSSLYKIYIFNAYRLELAAACHALANMDVFHALRLNKSDYVEFAFYVETKTE